MLLEEKVGKEMTYVTHARTLVELRDEFLSDIARRASLIDMQIKNAPSARRATSLGLVRQELDSLQEFWTQIELRRAPKGHQTD